MTNDLIPATRAAAVRWAKHVVEDGRTVFLDTETTGLGADAEICDIGVIALDGTVLLDSLVRPNRPIPLAAAQVHGISDEMVADARSWNMVYRELVDTLDGVDRVVVYNLQYDLPLINAVSAKAGFIPIDADDSRAWTCAMKAYSQYDGTLGKYGDLKWHKLDAACQAFGINPGGHRAMADAEATRLLVLAMANEVEPW